MTKGTYDYNNLINYCNSNNIILDNNYDNIKVTRDTIIIGKCNSNICMDKFSKTFRQLKVSGNYCNNCTKYKQKEKSINTCLTRYGVKHIMQTDSFKEQSKQTILKKYGVENVSQSECIKNKKELTCHQNHGVSNSFNSPKIREKIKQTFLIKYGVDNPLKNETIKQIIRETHLNKYGVENPQQNKEIKQKTKNTCLEKYGVDNIFKLESVIKKRADMCFQKYGSFYPIQSKLGKEKIKQTNILKYGVENPQQNSEIAEKTAKNSFRKKEYIFPSGNKILCQGYEPFALDKLVNEDNISEENIVTGCKNVPIIWYKDEFGKRHRHYVDIFISNQNRCIEIKSTWTAEKKKDNIFLKQTAAKELGYSYEIWIYNSKKQLNIIY